MSGRPDRMGAVLLAIALGLLLTADGSAQTGAAREYQVEIIVFDYPDPPPSAELVLQPRALLEADWSDWSAGAGADEIPWTRFPLLEDSALALGGLQQRLSASRAYRPLLHMGWRQNVVGPRGTVAQSVPALPSGAAVSGDIRLYRRQSLHLDLDLRLAAGSALETPETAGEYRLREVRIVRAGELNYFDHPRFGVIARVAPVEPGEPAQAEPVSAGAEAAP